MGCAPWKSWRVLYKRGHMDGFFSRRRKMRVALHAAGWPARSRYTLRRAAPRSAPRQRVVRASSHSPAPALSPAALPPQSCNTTCNAAAPVAQAQICSPGLHRCAGCLTHCFCIFLASRAALFPPEIDSLWLDFSSCMILPLHCCIACLLLHMLRAHARRLRRRLRVADGGWQRRMAWLAPPRH